MKVKLTNGKKFRPTSPPSSTKIANPKTTPNSWKSASPNQINDFYALDILLSTYLKFIIIMIVGVTAVTLTIGLVIWDIKSKKRHQRDSVNICVTGGPYMLPLL